MLVLDGEDITAESDFHAAFAAHPKVPGFYGRNRAALWDALTGLIERPFSIVWFNANHSKTVMKSEFESILEICREAEREDSKKMDWPDSEKFKIHVLDGPLPLDEDRSGPVA